MKYSYKDIPEVTSENGEAKIFEPSELTNDKKQSAISAIAESKIEGPEGFGLKDYCIVQGSGLSFLCEIQPHNKVFAKEVDGISVADHLRAIQYYGDPTILNEAYRLEEPKWAAFPLLNPSMMRRLPKKEMAKHFEAMRDRNVAERFIQEGPTLILTDRDEEVAAYDGSIERIVDTVRDRIDESTWAIMSMPKKSIVQKIKIGTKASPSLIFNIAEYPVTEEINPNAVLLYLQGKRITPSVIAQIIRKAGIEGALGIHIVVDGEIVCSAPHTLPTHAIEIKDLKSSDYINIVKQNGTFTGNGISSALPGHSNDAHIHTDLGHMIETSGTVVVYISQARAEMAVEYAENIIKREK